MKFVGDVLFFENNPRIIESKIIEFILSLRNKGKSHGAILNYLHAIKIRQLNNRSFREVTKKGRDATIEKSRLDILESKFKQIEHQIKIKI